MEKLTKKQDEILDCIKEFIADHGFPPTVREICRIKNLSSPSTVQMHLNSLVDKGYIKKDKIKNRTIELLVENEYINKKNSIIKVPFINNDKNEFINIPSSIISAIFSSSMTGRWLFSVSSAFCSAPSAQRGFPAAVSCRRFRQS